MTDMPYTPTWNNPYVTAPQAMQVQPTYQPQQIGYPIQQGPKKVNGPQSALQFPLAPNTQSDPLFDMNGKVFYIVTADSAGYKTLETFDFSPHVDESVASPTQSQVTREEFDALARKVNDMEAINGVHGSVPAGTVVAGNAGE